MFFKKVEIYSLTISYMYMSESDYSHSHSFTAPPNKLFPSLYNLSSALMCFYFVL